MSTTNPVSVEIQANVTGRESVVDLTQRLDDMAKVLEDDLKDQAQAAAARLRELAQQQDAVATFERLKREAADAAAALKRADAETANFTAQIGQAGPPTAGEAEALQRLQAAADGARSKLAEQRTALAGAASALQSYGIASKNTQDAQQRLAVEVEQVRASVANLAPAYQRAASGAASASQQIQRSHSAIGESVESINTALGRVQNAFLALQGGGFVGGEIKDIAATADAYNGLAGRIKLATGEGAAFQAGVEGVERVAIDTRSALEATGELYTRIASAGKTLGLSQQDALGLTQTINQAIQITGGSAQASEAAITQLNQGLQSGVLRGDEFNSVMEQAPRLARALAEGLGVGTGKLREMAEQGLLTSDTIIKALRGQSDAVATEFNKLPPSVGGALQNLSTAWTIYVGNVDKSTGASRTAAEAIAYLAQNLEPIVGTIAEVGKGVAALTLLKLATSFRDWALGAAQATTALTVNTAATAANTAAARANAAATAAAGAASVDAAAKKGLLSVAMGGVVVAGRGLLNVLGGPVGLLALTATYAKDIGELTAKMVLKLQGTKSLEQAEKDLAEQEKRSYEQAQALSAARAKQAQADADAAAAKFGLSDAAKKLIADFDKLIKDGKTVDEAINSIGKDFDLSSRPGIAAAAGVLDKLASDGRLTAEQFRRAWAEALDGKDLQKFEVLARAALGGVERSVIQLSQALDAQLREAIKRAGLDFDVISGGMSQASVSALNDVESIISGFDKLKASGANASQALAASFVKAIDTADSQKALDLLNQRIESSRKLLGDTITGGLLAQAKDRAIELKSALDDLTPGINSTAEAMRVLGVTSQKSLDETATKFKSAYETMRSSGTATARELQDRFVRYADAAIKANGGVASESLKVEAAMRGLEIAADGTCRKIVDGMGNAQRAAASLTGTVEDQISVLERENATIERANAAREKALDLERKRLNVDKDGFTLDSSGNRMSVLVPTRKSVAADAVSQGVDEATAKSIAEQFIDVRGNAQGWAGFKTLADAIQAAIDKALERQSSTSKSSDTSSVSNSVPVIINLGTLSKKVNVASNADAAALQAVLAELMAAAGRTA